MKIETVVVTGGIGSGKSSVIEMIKQTSEVKVDFFNFDDYTNELYTKDEVKDFLVTMFGTSDKAEISNIVFDKDKQDTSKILLDELNEFFFKMVESKFIELVNRKHGHTLVIEMPMYFEMKKLSTNMQMTRSKVKVIVVACDDDVRIARVKQRDDFTEEKIRDIMSVQMPQSIKIENADYVIDTTDGKNIEVRVLKVLNLLLLMDKFNLRKFFHGKNKSEYTNNAV